MIALLITNKEDISADWVVRELRETSRPFIRLNTEDLPKGRVEWDGDLCCFRLATREGRIVHQQEVHSVWYRRPGRPFGDRTLPDSPEAVLNAQWRAFLDALSLSAEALWVNHPQANSVAESKIQQLKTAREVGLSYPPTLITNDPSAVTRFKDRFGQVVVKALDAPLVIAGDAEAFMFTTRLPETDLDPESVQAAPMIYQQRIEPRADIRVTVVGDAVFAARAVGVTEQDWRLEPNPVQFESITLDDRTAVACVALVRRLNLTFGAIDLLETPTGFTFLEVNPNGEWGWLQASGIDIAKALADVLA